MIPIDRPTAARRWPELVGVVRHLRLSFPEGRIGRAWDDECEYMADGFVRMPEGVRWTGMPQWPMPKDWRKQLR